MLISISLDTDLNVLKEFIRENNLTWPQVIDSGRKQGASRHSGVMATTYKAKGVPKYILIDKQGTIRYNSYVSENKFISEEVLDKYLK